MDAVAPLLAAALTVVVGTLLGYIVGNRRLKYERILERRAEVIAEMTKMMASLQRSLDKMSRTGIDAEERRENRAQASQTLAELGEYFARNEVWLSRETCRKIEDLFFTLGMSLEDYLQVGHGPDPLDAHPNQRMQLLSMIATRRDELLEEFRDILYPQPWYDPPRRWLRRLRKHP
jgi:hypothetical protein